MNAADKKRAAFHAAIKPYMDRICDNAPDFRSAGVMLVFYDGQLTSIDLSEIAQRSVAPHAMSEGGAS